VIERGDEGLVEGAHDLVRDPITLPLEILYLPPAGRGVLGIVENVLEKRARVDEYRSLLLEEIVEALLPGN